MAVALPARTIAPIGPSRTMRSRACCSASIGFTWFTVDYSGQVCENARRANALDGLITRFGADS